MKVSKGRLPRNQLLVKFKVVKEKCQSFKSSKDYKGPKIEQLLNFKFQLMAMGSSMPEIFLNIIEIFFNKFEAGELGPGI